MTDYTPYTVVYMAFEVAVAGGTMPVHSQGMAGIDTGVRCYMQ